MRYLVLPWILGFVLSAKAELKSKLVEYKQGQTVLEGFAVYDDATQGRRPAVLVVHQWKGLGDYEMKQAEMLARLGYNVLAVDIYGKGIRPEPKVRLTTRKQTSVRGKP